MNSIIVSMALLLSAKLAFAQEEKINFRTLAVSETNFPELWVVDSARPVLISFPVSQPSLATKADRTNPLAIFRGPLDAKGKPMDTAPTLVSLPASSSILLLGWMEGEKPGFLAIEDPFPTMRSDDWLVINSSKTPLAIQIGETAKPLPIKANSYQAIKCSAPIGTGAAVTIASQQANGQWKAVYSSYWPIYEDKRGLVLIAQTGARLNVNYITDQISPNPVIKP